MTRAEAVKIFGSVRRLAEALSISDQAVRSWGDDVPPLRRYQILEILARRESTGAEQTGEPL